MTLPEGSEGQAEDEKTPPLYLDYNATTPVHETVLKAMLPFFSQHFGNASSSHAFGKAPAAALRRARSRVAAVLNCAPAEVVFTGGATESIHMALRGVDASGVRKAGGKPHVVLSAVEHPATRAAVLWLTEREGWESSVVGVDGRGVVSPAAVAAAVIPGRTLLVTVMLANNEVGTVQDIAAIRAALPAGVLLHTDASQAVGKVGCDVRALRCDLLTVAGHKFYAPKGVGALFVRAGVQLRPLIGGGGQEGGRRAGTENVAYCVALGAACQLVTDRHAATVRHLRTVRDALWAALQEAVSRSAVRGMQLRRNGDPEGGLPNTLSVGFRGIVAGDLISAVGGVLVASAGAACHAADEVSLSKVLTAMRVPKEFAHGTVRLSVGLPTTVEDVRRAAAALVKEYGELLAAMAAAASVRASAAAAAAAPPPPPGQGDEEPAT